MRTKKKKQKKKKRNLHANKSIELHFTRKNRRISTCLAELSLTTASDKKQSFLCSSFSMSEDEEVPVVGDIPDTSPMVFTTLAQVCGGFGASKQKTPTCKTPGQAPDRVLCEEQTYAVFDHFAAPRMPVELSSSSQRSKGHRVSTTVTNLLVSDPEPTYRYVRPVPYGIGDMTLPELNNFLMDIESKDNGSDQSSENKGFCYNGKDYRDIASCIFQHPEHAEDILGTALSGGRLSLAGVSKYIERNREKKIHPFTDERDTVTPTTSGWSLPEFNDLLVRMESKNSGSDQSSEDESFCYNGKNYRDIASCISQHPEHAEDILGTALTGGTISPARVSKYLERRREEKFHPSTEERDTVAPTTTGFHFRGQHYTDVPSCLCRWPRDVGSILREAVGQGAISESEANFYVARMTPEGQEPRRFSTPKQLQSTLPNNGETEMFFAQEAWDLDERETRRKKQRSGERRWEFDGKNLMEEARQRQIDEAEEYTRPRSAMKELLKEQLDSAEKLDSAKHLHRQYPVTLHEAIRKREEDDAEGIKKRTQVINVQLSRKIAQEKAKERKKKPMLERVDEEKVCGQCDQRRAKGHCMILSKFDGKFRCGPLYQPHPSCAYKHMVRVTEESMDTCNKVMIMVGTTSKAQELQVARLEEMLTKYHADLSKATKQAVAAKLLANVANREVRSIREHYSSSRFGEMEKELKELKEAKKRLKTENVEYDLTLSNRAIRIERLEEQLSTARSKRDAKERKYRQCKEDIAVAQTERDSAIESMEGKILRLKQLEESTAGIRETNIMLEAQVKRGICVVCTAQPSSILYKECGHICVCSTCSLTMEDEGKEAECPYCRSVGMRRDVFIT